MKLQTDKQNSPPPSVASGVKIFKVAKQLFLYWNTIKYLRPIQILNRIIRKVPKKILRLSRTPRFSLPEKTWQVPIQGSPCILSSDEFCLLGVRGRLSEIGWNGEERPRLWRYNQHYFDDLTAKNAESRKEWQNFLLEDWIEQNPPHKGVGWEPYPISLRIVNCIKWFLAGNHPTETLLQSLFYQAEYLSRSVEWHLLANHLIANAKALVFAGGFFEGKVTHVWLRKGMSILRKQFTEQILHDGGHFELSPMYHSIILEDLYDIINFCRGYGLVGGFCSFCETISAKMLDWLKTMVHPDGDIAFFNDSALGVSAPLEMLSAYSKRLKIRTAQHNVHDEPSAKGGDSSHMLQLKALSASGYIRLESQDTVVLIDCAKIGPSYQPGHAHADTLSFECSHAGQRVFVNGGTSTYEATYQRVAERQTKSHNTVEIHGTSSSEVWSAFRTARRAYPKVPQIQQNDDAIQVTCGHTGYRWLRGRPQHNRSWTLTNTGLLIEDTVTGAYGAVARFRLHPQIIVDIVDKNTIQLKIGTGDRLYVVIREGTWRIVESNFAPRFFDSQNTKTLECTLQKSAKVQRSLVELCWTNRTK